MNCKKCGSKLVDGCCIKCGYMINDNQINLHSEAKDKLEDQKIFNKSFIDMYINNKTYINFLLGPLYFSYRGHLFTGILFCILHYINIIFIPYINITLFPSTILIYLYIFISRVFYAAFANTICLWIDKINIKRIKNKYESNYREKLIKHKHRKIYLIYNIVILIIVVLIFTIFKRYQNGLI